MVDTNNDGVITAEELTDVMAKYHMDESDIEGLNDLINHCQKEPDMEISLSKFREVVTPLTDMPYHPPQPKCLHKRAPEPTFD